MRFGVAPSILSADFSRLAEEIRLVEPYADRIHVDVMDGHFVPNLTLGPVVVESIRPVTSLPLEVHLMVEEPGKFVEAFTRAGANRLIFHVEVSRPSDELPAAIRSLGAVAGIAINPGTEWSAAEPYLEEIDLVTVMTVHPGFGGQAFMREMTPKISEARRRLTDLGVDVDIEVDGGIDVETARIARESGANIFVAGHGIFRSGDVAAAAKELTSVVAS